MFAKRVVFGVLLLLSGQAWAAEWDRVALEGNSFRIDGPQLLVRYRATATSPFVDKVLAKGTHQCDNATFTDPTPGDYKECVAKAREYGPAPSCWPLSLAARSFSVTTFPSDRLAWMMEDGAKASFTVTWFCRTEYGYTSHGLSGFKAEMYPDISSLVRIFSAGNDTERSAAYVAGLGCLPDGSADPCAKYRVLDAGALQQLEFGRANLTPIVWKVRTNGTTTTRPMYRVVNGVRQTTALAPPLRAIVGETCRCMTLAIKESTSTYCPVPELPQDAVTLCGLVK